LLLLLVVRLIGRRPAGMIAPFDVVLLVLIGGIAIGPIIGKDHSLLSAVVAVFSLGLTHSLLAWLKGRFPLLRRIFDGTPVVVYERGRWHEDRLRALRLTAQDVMAAARQRGLTRLEQVQCAVAEGDGNIAIVERQE
jgi:uncharacterized membrane protein YcaP (DUF421 family)